MDQSSQKSERVEKTNFEMELIVNVDCFLDGYGNHASK